MELVKFIGKIMSSPNAKGEFQAYAVQADKMFKMQYSAYNEKSHIQTGDVIKCIGYRNNDNILIQEQPVIQICCDEKTFLGLIIRALHGKNFGGRKVKFLYNYLDDAIKRKSFETIVNDNNITSTPYDLLSKLSLQYMKYVENNNTISSIINTKVNNSSTSGTSRFSSIADCPAVMFLSRATFKVNKEEEQLISIAQCEVLFKWWIANYDRRRLYCLGLTNDEIFAYPYGPYKMYLEILKNPYTIPTLSLDRCKSLDSMTGRLEHPQDMLCGTVLRSVYTNRTNKGYTCTKYTWLKKRFNFIDTIRSRLISVFKIIFDIIPIYPDNDDGSPHIISRIIDGTYGNTTTTTNNTNNNNINNTSNNSNTTTSTCTTNITNDHSIENTDSKEIVGYIEETIDNSISASNSNVVCRSSSGSSDLINTLIKSGNLSNTINNILNNSLIDNKTKTEVKNNILEVVYEKRIWKIDVGICNYLVDLINGDLIHDMCDPVYDDKLDEDQRKAIYTATTSNVCMITGPAGSGKTTTLKCLCHNYEINDVEYVVLSFTGKAVVRAKELNGLGDRAATIHRSILGSFEHKDFGVAIIRRVNNVRR